MLFQRMIEESELFMIVVPQVLWNTCGKDLSRALDLSPLCGHLSTYFVAQGPRNSTERIDPGTTRAKTALKLQGMIRYPRRSTIFGCEQQYLVAVR